ncbi:DNA-3-methyladenine glycosylase I [Leucobacter luti]|uniref:DNA-3-methyladenine glycosylase I n=1 Tax=Leucobacter luti TaxID=340320 RepID=UPI00105146AF|nr:DNA-3-methyladenine glycosylase I [Leucobacter luti]MCW2288103.1 DNA-3-methyladenine glycosylase I [Leucobacter luti]TCK45735.1 DNA-3-methyladenine glycosylase I [Leucobacter luti]
MSVHAATPRRASWATQDPLLLEYYDTEWGEPVTDDRGVYERLSLEAFQTGLSWLTVLRKREAFREAFAGFDPERVARFTESDVARLLSDQRIIRNRLKIRATITNAQATIRMSEREGPSLARLVWSYMPVHSPAPVTDAQVPSTSRESRELATELRGLGFSFVGPTTVFALMAAIGVTDTHLVRSPRRGCSGLWNIDGTRSNVPAPFGSTLVE